MSSQEDNHRQEDLAYECRGLVIDGEFQRLYIDQDWFRELEKGKPFLSFTPDPPFRTRTIWQNLIKIFKPWTTGFRVTVPIYHHKLRGIKNRQRIMIKVLVVDDNIADYQSTRLPPS